MTNWIILFETKKKEPIINSDEIRHLLAAFELKRKKKNHFISDRKLIRCKQRTEMRKKKNTTDSARERSQTSSWHHSGAYNIQFGFLFSYYGDFTLRFRKPVHLFYYFK